MQRNPQVIDVGNFYELRKSGDQEQSANAYIAGLRHRAECGLPLGGIASFATPPASGGDEATDAHGEMLSEAAFSDLRRLAARSQALLRQPMLERRSCLRRVVLLRGDERHSGDGALGAVASCPKQPA
jgi:hypothetical protein